MKDFTLYIYRELLESLQKAGYELISYAEYCKGRRPERFVILRHDVDAKSSNSLRTAQIEHSIGAKASYYFRSSESGAFSPDTIRAIAKLGHEIGYHYEDMSLCNGDAEKAHAHFETWLENLRRFYAVETICMHGAPTSQWDSKDLWKRYDYRQSGIIGEPYLDTDFSDVFYLTDTGRCWDGFRVSVRDKIPGFQEQWTAKGLTWHTTDELLLAVKQGLMPAHVMMTTHPQRWTNNSREWYKELIVQTIKNGIKFCINRSGRLHSSAAH